jgi:hypothetical protein
MLKMLRWPSLPSQANIIETMGKLPEREASGETNESPLGAGAFV